MKKTLTLLVIFTFLFLSTGCVNKNENLTPAGSDKNQAIENEKGSNLEGFVPQKPEPENLPIYPGAVLVNDAISYGENKWQWFYETTASGTEIVNYFTEAFEDMGIEVDAEGTFTFYEEFFVSTEKYVATVYWLGTDELGEDINADTPGRSYAIIIDFNLWNK